MAMIDPEYGSNSCSLTTLRPDASNLRYLAISQQISTYTGFQGEDDNALMNSRKIATTRSVRRTAVHLARVQMQMQTQARNLPDVLLAVFPYIVICRGGRKNGVEHSG